MISIIEKNGGSSFSDFPKVTWITRGRVKIQARVVLIPKAVVSQLWD